jgi:hypothetical protein
MYIGKEAKKISRTENGKNNRELTGIGGEGMKLL